MYGTSPEYLYVHINYCIILVNFNHEEYLKQMCQFLCHLVYIT